MQVFKLSLNIVKKNIGQIIMYLCIFLVLILMFSSVSQQNSISNYEGYNLKIGIVDEDNSELSKALSAYILNENTEVEIENDDQKIRDAIFYRFIDYVLIIPADFQKNFLNQNTTLDNIKVPDSFTGIFVDMQINEYLQTIATYLGSEIPLTDAIGYVEEQASKPELIEIVSEQGSDYPKYYYYFSYLNYIFLAIAVLSIGQIIMSLNKVDIRKKHFSSAIRPMSINIGMAAACVVVILGIYIFLNLIAIVLYRNEPGFFDNYIYLFVNGLGISIVALSIGFVTGTLAKSVNALSGMQNCIGLGFSFLGGVFVPQAVMSESTLRMGRFTPCYWNVKLIDTVLAGNIKNNMDSYYQYLGIQLMFAVAIFSVGFLVISRRAKNVL